MTHYTEAQRYRVEKVYNEIQSLAEEIETGTEGKRGVFDNIELLWLIFTARNAVSNVLTAMNKRE